MAKAHKNGISGHTGGGVDAERVRAALRAIPEDELDRTGDLPGTELDEPQLAPDGPNHRQRTTDH